MPKSGCVNVIRNLFQDLHKPLNLQLELSDLNTVLAMVKEGVGITLIPTMSLPDNLAALSPIERHRQQPQNRFACHTRLCRTYAKLPWPGREITHGKGRRGCRSRVGVDNACAMSDSNTQVCPGTRPFSDSALVQVSCFQ